MKHLLKFLFKISSQELNLPILKTTSTELVSGISGDSEYKIRKLFEQAKVRKSTTFCNKTKQKLSFSVIRHVFYLLMKSKLFHSGVNQLRKIWNDVL